MRAVVLVILGSAVAVPIACGGLRPTKLDLATAQETPPEKLCEHYVGLEAKAIPGIDQAQKLDKCLGKARATRSASLPYYGCLVQCTFAAATFDAARDCPFRCTGTGGYAPASPTSAVNPNAGPAPADSDPGPPEGL